MPVPTKVAFIKYRHRRDAAVALHMTNTILVDKLIQVIPWRSGEFTFFISYNLEVLQVHTLYYFTVCFISIQMVYKK